ncbi:uncharacterized protein EAF01_005831 [Botrytis porri]|uniref:uncharacterized protein n=1 Tax=Botrytis porri TaxID=87229 RepID=UPI0018FF915B|nr:uncharacterized protein EAF01_005831 [Botrytis porri]KAF7905310.1 hypothetical protein EAF01_005831 [Botrytis porri]
MPVFFRPSPFVVPRIRPQRFSFHSTAIYRNPAQNHYETLQVAPDATPAEIKKSFYALSKVHHPDHNPSDPSASKRFVKISEAWAILGTPAKRQAYDREHHIHSHAHGHGHSHGTGHRPPQGSYSSSGPAGGRPASGLSRRRTQFRGPPPSFYRSGGWGEHSAKRRAAQDNGAPGAEAPPKTEMGGGMGTGQMPWGPEGDIPHFDKRAHTQTHDNVDRRRRRRMSEHFIPADQERSTFANFVILSAVISMSVAVPSYIYERMTSAGRPKKI